MSGEYFGGDVVNDDTHYLEEKHFTDEKIVNWSYGTNESCKGEEGQDIKLYEMGEALEIAENRCNTLREELDLMKTNYRDKITQDVAGSLKDCRKISATKGRSLVRQNSEAIETDNSGAAVVTINNILTGITNSINRLSELHSCTKIERIHSRSRGSRHSRAKSSMEIIEDDYRRGSSACSCIKTSSVTTNVKRREHKRHAKRRSRASLNSSSSMIQVRDRRKESSTSRHGIEEDNGKGEGATSMKKQKKRIKRLKQVSKTSVIKKNRELTKNASNPSNHLVELYHNAAANSSESDDYLDGQTTYHAKSSHVDVKARPKKTQNVPPAPMHHHKEEVVCYSNVRQDNRSLSPIEERIDVSDPCNDVEFNALYHNYETPTIASRMKQVARGYLRPINSKAIPFCAAKSTTPSHNIGINIQQVMSIIKTRQPIKGISPTLAHNIGLAAEKLNHRSLSAMVSSLGSRMGYGYPTCPMIRNSFNYQQLQEMAKEVPEDDEPIEEVPEDYRDESGNQEPAEPPPQTVWAVDQSVQMNCTCIPQKGVGFQQVLNRYQLFPQQMVASQQNHYAQKIKKRSQQKYKHIRSVYAQYNDSLKKKSDIPEDTMVDSKSESNIPVKGKEKMLKGVLVNLHEEFRQLHQKHESLSKNASGASEGNTNDEDAKELEWLDKKLNDKEEEIQMVMSLYTEVINLKQEVKALREKASLASLMVEQQKQQYQMAYEKQWQYQQQYQQYQPKHRVQQKGSTAAVHLTKMLRQIQTFKEVHKNGGK